MVPNKITDNALISKQPALALEVFEAMQLQGMVPHIINYNAFISTCEKGKQPEQAL